MKLNMQNNPVLIIVGGLGTVVHALLGLLLAFGVHLSQLQVGAVEGLLGSLVAVVLAVAARSQVDSPATVSRLMDLTGSKSRVDSEAGQTPIVVVLIVLVIVFLVLWATGVIPK